MSIEKLDDETERLFQAAVVNRNSSEAIALRSRIRELQNQAYEKGHTHGAHAAHEGLR